MRKIIDPTALVLTVITMLMIVVAICSTGSCHGIVEALDRAANQAIDHVLFDDEAQAALYENEFGR